VSIVRTDIATFTGPSERAGSVNREDTCTWELDVLAIVWHGMSDMSTTQITTRRFTKEFRSVRTRLLQVTDRGEVLGIWTPAPATSVPVDFEERARKDSAAAMPVSFATLLKEGKKR
jgi:hypothetical protein